ncbi:hypothetical protein [Flavobacterium hydrophilum]|uniref:Uncharacterized protein n=1 Tax=Flavobacterium hydrophilum TaxID=2211445 RepID=A0A2V4C629_9FLAO|nr:hypothetical protein [Flavobacterium hydrophilum]PXY46816.1 hypothetical protein DMB68_06570 [Flavobacterium hydrophilum]
MSSYNENLNASVVSSLQAQELKLSNTQAQLNAGMFTLYYAEDAKITAQEKLKRTEQKYSDQEIIKEEAVGDNNLINNVVATANQEKQFNLQSVSNTAVSAANVQIATNAIVNLASDMGSIVSILNAADYGSQIYEQALAVNKLMNDTAYNAEVTSQLAMEASSLTAEVTASTVSDMATSTAGSITNLLSILNSQLEATSALQTTENANYASAATAQKKAEGELIDAKVDFDATKSTYLSSINELNLNLQIKSKSNIDFTVQFDAYLNPFYNDIENLVNGIITYPYNVSPVENYYIFVVKESERTIFSMTIAEGLINSPNIAIPVNNKKNQATIEKKISITGIKDINNEAITLGENYVVFVLAQFTVDYKKSLNNFEDYLTASSSPFILTTQLKSPNPEAIKVVFLDEKENSNNITSQVLQFDLNEKNNTVEYRCMFIPDNSAFVNGMFKTQDLQSIEEQFVKEVSEEIEKYKAVDDESEINNLLEILKEELEKLTTENTPKAAADSTKNDADADTENDAVQNTSLIEEIKTNISTLESKLKSSTPSDSSVETNSSNKTPKPGFFFNKLIAENVTDGNYTVPTGDQIKIDSKTNIKSVTLPILENTTDNFGNPLIEGNEYIPVVLSVASGPKKVAVQFSSSISDFVNTDTFRYHTIKPITEKNN